MKIIGLVGWSGSGKTTLLVKLLPVLAGRGLRVSTMKHSHHDFAIDREGKDSFRHRAAGATEVLLTCSRRWALMHELHDRPEPDIEALIERMAPVDLLLIEGFRDHTHAKIEVHRAATGKSLIFGGDSTLVAVASDETLPGLGVPVLDLDDVSAIADFVLAAQLHDAGVRDGTA